MKRIGIVVCVESDPKRGGSEPVAAEQVHCLACGFVYSKPVNGALRSNPDCPKCGYVGWLSATIPSGAANAEHEPPRLLH